MKTQSITATLYDHNGNTQDVTVEYEAIWTGFKLLVNYSNISSVMNIICGDEHEDLQVAFAVAFELFDRNGNPETHKVAIECEITHEVKEVNNLKSIAA
jgi:hypothetical protein